MPLPGNPQGPTVFRVETGIEGNNGFFWSPGPGDPGSDLSGILPGLSYNIISDAAVPEPSSMMLVLASAVLVGLHRFCRRSCRV